jgi:hypothetical protein
MAGRATLRCLKSKANATRRQQVIGIGGTLALWLPVQRSIRIGQGKSR